MRRRRDGWRSFGVEPAVVLADAGYCNEPDLLELENRGIDAHVALGREGKSRVAVDPARLPATHRMGEKLASLTGKARYAQRKWLSEAPNGWIKEVLGFRRYTLRAVREHAGGQIKTAFKGACRRAGITDFTPHDCRHTWATWTYAARRDIGELMELGGWSSEAMVMRYAHVNPDHLTEAIAALPWEKSGERLPAPHVRR